jgi:hypothetical protein
MRCGGGLSLGLCCYIDAPVWGQLPEELLALLMRTAAQCCYVRDGSCVADARLWTQCILL